jgi:hypothetical protein
MPTDFPAAGANFEGVKLEFEFEMPAHKEDKKL